MRADETHEVPASARGDRLDRWLSALPGVGTRSQIGAAITAGRVTVDGEPAKAARRLRGGERVTVRAAEPRASDARVGAQDIAIDVLFADDVLVAINKAPGMVVHPAVGNRDGTLVNAILHRFPGAGWPGAPERAGIVHRLDRDTSGVILVARTVEAHESLAKQFRNRSVEKEYLALVRADVARAGQIEDPIGRHPRDRKRMSTAARRARSAATAYEPLERFGAATLLLVRPRTGRTHQIRVHLASRGWPVVADPVYGRPSERAAAAYRRRWGPLAAAVAQMPRQALHASRIRFSHPASGEPMEVGAALPADFLRVLGALRQKAPARTPR